MVGADFDPAFADFEDFPPGIGDIVHGLVEGGDAACGAGGLGVDVVFVEVAGGEDVEGSAAHPGATLG